MITHKAKKIESSIASIHAAMDGVVDFNIGVCNNNKIITDEPNGISNALLDVSHNSKKTDTTRDVSHTLNMTNKNTNMTERIAYHKRDISRDNKERDYHETQGVSCNDNRIESIPSEHVSNNEITTNATHSWNDRSEIQNDIRAIHNDGDNTQTNNTQRDAHNSKNSLPLTLPQLKQGV